MPPRFNTEALAFYLETLPCGYTVYKDIMLQNKNVAIHTPSTCVNCKKGKFPIILHAYTGLCNHDKCTYETEPNQFHIVTEELREHTATVHKPVKGRPRKKKDAPK